MSGVLSALIAVPAFLLPGTSAADKAASRQPPSYTVLFFTASWCGPCRAVYPILDEWVRRNDKKVKLVIVDYDRAQEEVARWDVHEIPVVVVISHEGRILLRSQGGDRETLTTLKSALDGLVRKPRKRSKS